MFVRGKLMDNLSKTDLLRYIVQETLWMARRYAHKREVAEVVNECIGIALALKVHIETDTVTEEMYARGVGGAEWDAKGKGFKDI